MKNLVDLTTDDVLSAYNDKGSLKFLVSEDATQFRRHLPNQDFQTPTEVPPSPILLNAETIAWAIMKGGNSIQGKYASLVLLIYASKGKIFYSKSAENEYLADVSWPNP